MYEIIKAEGQPIRLNTMGEVLWELNGNGLCRRSAYQGDALHQIGLPKRFGKKIIAAGGKSVVLVE